MGVYERGNKALRVEAARESDARCTNTELSATGCGEGASTAVGELCCCNFRMLLQYSCLSTRAPPAPAFHMLTPCRNLAGPGFPPLGGGNGRLELQSISGWNAPGKGIGPRGEVACDLCLLVPALTIPGGTVEFNECKVWGKTGGF